MLLTNSYNPLSRLIYELTKLPGIGEKTATRLAYFVLKQDLEDINGLVSALLNAKQKISFCSTCFTFTDVNPCQICSSSKREQTVICVVEKPADVHSIESSQTYNGLYHVLHGVLSPLDGIGPEELKIKEFLNRLREGQSVVKEVILATNPSVEGEATALYMARLLRPLGLKITQLAYGLPVGGLIEYVDKQTLGKAVLNRMEIN
ncbi:MAG: recombination protein RecR [Deltaproteobacteria bacterium]|nr:recombination protein RecR [Deltaproteobacteria bacterium]